jgi:hypothetical protein
MFDERRIRKGQLGGGKQGAMVEKRNKSLSRNTQNKKFSKF